MDGLAGAGTGRIGNGQMLGDEAGAMEGLEDGQGRRRREENLEEEHGHVEEEGDEEDGEREQLHDGGRPDEEVNIK